MMEPLPHYYGDIVRKIFLVGGLIMLITLPFLKENISSPVFYSILAILILTFFAGMTNPKQKKIIASDIIVSVLGFGVFAYQAVVKFDGFFNLFFMTNIVLSLLFLFAFYWSVKTIRWLKFPKKIQIGDISAKSENDQIINASEDASTASKAKLTEKLTDEQLRKKRFLGNGE